MLNVIQGRFGALAGWLAVAGWPPVTAWLAGRGCLAGWLAAWLWLNQKSLKFLGFCSTRMLRHAHRIIQKVMFCLHILKLFERTMKQ